MVESRKLAAILVADIVGYSRLTGTDEEGTLARLRALRSDLIDPAIASHDGRLVKRTGDGAIVEFRSVVEAVRCAIEVRDGFAERNAGLPADQCIEARVGIHLGDVIEEADGDLMGDGVNIAARLEGICEPGGLCLSEDAYRQVRDKIDVAFVDLGEQNLKNIARPMRAYALTAPTGRSLATRSETAVPKLPRWSWRGWERRHALNPILENIVIPSIGQRPRSRRERRAAMATAVTAILENIARPEEADQEKAAPRLSLVVLPFANLSGDPEQDYFADGLTDDLTTDLSRLPDSFVIAHNTALTYKGKPVEARRLGRELGVRYAVEGSVRRVAETIAVNAQLISTETGAHVWADRFEGERSRLRELQAELVARIANALGVQIRPRPIQTD